MAKIVEGVGSAVSSRYGQELGQAMEQAMVAAINECRAQGVTDPDVIRQMQLDAARSVKEDYERRAAAPKEE